MPVLSDTGSNNVGDDVDGPDGGLSPAQHRSHPMVSDAVEESREQWPGLQSLQPRGDQRVQVGRCSVGRRQFFHRRWQGGRQTTHGGV